MKRKIFALFLVVATVFLGSCSREARLEHCELGILLPDAFREYDPQGAFDAAYACDNTIVGMTRVSFEAAALDGIASTLEARQFASVYKTGYGHDGRIRNYADVPYYSYTVDGNVASLTYYHTFYKTPYAFYIITFITPTKGGVSSTNLLKLTENVYLIQDK